MSTTQAALDGTYELDPIHSYFGFSVVHYGLSQYRGWFTDVDATLRVGGGEGHLAGKASVESISILQPPSFRQNILGEGFFDASHHPTISFRSSSLSFDPAGVVDLHGELTIRGTTRPIAASGSYTPPRTTSGDRLSVALAFTTRFDRRDFGMDWQMELPDGRLAVAWEVGVDAEFELKRVEDDSANK
jgi:polyisoprenoid-binding protein YceI